MRSIENERGMPLHKPQPEDAENRRIRKGKVGGSAGYLDREDQEYIYRAGESLLTDTSKALLRRYGLWTAET
jgi:alcohol sulfotransferase